MLVQMCFFYLTVNILLKLFWITINSSFLVIEGVQFFLRDIGYFFAFIADCIKFYKDYIKRSLNISAHLSMKIILVDPNLVRTYFGNNFFDPNYGMHPRK